ncbi:MAG TPA: hypothetical protein VGD47_00420 [Steroidobacteraceae bacterium]
MSGSVQRIPAIRGSRYAGELKKGARDMRFPPDLEREYHHFYLAERRTHVRSFNLIMAALMALAGTDALWGEPLRAHLAQYLRLGAIAVSYLVMAWAAYSRHYERFYLQTARYASVVISLVGAVEIAHRIRGGGASSSGC